MPFNVNYNYPNFIYSRKATSRIFPLGPSVGPNVKKPRTTTFSNTRTGGSSSCSSSTSAFFIFVLEISFIVDSTEEEYRSILRGPASFPYHYFPSLSAARNQNIVKNTTAVRERGQKTRFFKCFLVVLWWKGKNPISRRHKLIRSWLQPPWTLCPFASYAQSGVIVLKRRVLVEKTSKGKRREKLVFACLFKSINRRDGPHLSRSLHSASFIFAYTQFDNRDVAFLESFLWLARSNL